MRVGRGHGQRAKRVIRGNKQNARRGGGSFVHAVSPRPKQEISAQNIKLCGVKTRNTLFFVLDYEHHEHEHEHRGD